MPKLQLFIQCLEVFLYREGAWLRREPLPDWVHGRLQGNGITLRSGLSPEQELPVLVHELAHWLSHSQPHPDVTRTLFEYEAEAVEQLVLQRIGVQPVSDSSDCSPTDDLLPASVLRVREASNRICGALGFEPL